MPKPRRRLHTNELEVDGAGLYKGLMSMQKIINAALALLSQAFIDLAKLVARAVVGAARSGALSEMD